MHKEREFNGNTSVIGAT